MRPSLVWLLLLALTAYGAGIFGTFFLDDYAIFSDPVLTSASGWWEVWRLEQTRPLTYFTFWLNYQTGGKNPIGYHALNVGLHLVAVWLAFNVLRRILPESIAWIAVAIFAAHPLQSEAVNYIFARSNLLMSVFSLFALNDWLKERRWRAVLWFGIALLAKEEAVGIPIFLLLLEISRSRLRSAWKQVAVMFIIAVIIGARVVVATATTPGSGAGAQAGFSSTQYFWTQGLVIWRYFFMAVIPVWPYRIDSPIVSGMYWWAWVGLVACAAISAMRYKDHQVGFWIFGSLVLLLPSSSIFPAADLAADRRMYLPMLPLAVAIALWVPRIGYVIPALAILSMIRTYDWLDAERFWRKQALRGSVRSQVQLARIVDPKEALRILETEKLHRPQEYLIASELGRLYLADGEREKALAEFGRALSINPDSPQALSNRGVALLMLKQTDAGRADFERALRIDPCTFEARLNATRMGLPLNAGSQCRYSEDQRKALFGK
ncbi:MAG TPA: tetratricopeptide repeat protein [Bryobacteraceae bacterium]|nr:tetratricopeptide repeat protein [Bryobacteraceae bacterium]